MARSVIASDMQDVHLAFMRSRDWFEFLDALKLAVVRPFVLELVPVNHFDRAVFAQHVFRQPHFAVAPAADPTNQFVIGN